jgi:hypothetical protein
MWTRDLSRRGFLEIATAAGISGLLPATRAGAAPSAEETQRIKDRKLLFVFCAYGGASIIDSFLPVLTSEVGDDALAATLNNYPEAMLEQKPGSSFRCPKLMPSYAYYGTPKQPLSELVARHGDDMVVMAHNVSSVNHTVGQQRSLNGGGFDRGRTIMESTAARHGIGLPLASCNMASDGYLRHGADASIPQFARHELINAPLMFAAGTHGYKGLSGVPGEAAIARARAVRDELDEKSVFARTFAKDARRSAYLTARGETMPRLEQSALLSKLLLLDASKVDAKYELEPNPLVGKLRETFPDLDLDRTQAQTALAFLMAFHGVSTSVTLGFNPDPAFDTAGNIMGSPIAFDFSHNMHPIVQSLMWCRTAYLLDKLITLLKTHDYLGDPELGPMWDRSLVYVATEFGRDKTRPSGAQVWGTGHHLNNGSLLISPLLKGNKVYGGVDPKTSLTYGFDPVTGAPDKSRIFYESDVYSVIAQALGLEVPGARAFPAVVRG